MKHLRTMLLLLCLCALASGCAKKDLIATQPAAGMGAEQAPPAAPTAVPSPADAAPEAVVVADIASGDLAPSDGANAETSPLEAVYFDFDSWLLTAPARETLARNADWLRKNPDIAVILEGHTDERGSDAYNLALGEQRAKSALKYLVNLGIDAGRMDVVSYGEEKPAVEGDDEASRSRNRRVQFTSRR